MSQGRFPLGNSIRNGGVSLPYFIVQNTNGLLKDVYAVITTYLILLVAQFSWVQVIRTGGCMDYLSINTFLITDAAGQIQTKAINPPEQ